MDTSVAAVTVKLVEPETPLRAAMIVVEPGLSAVASPIVPAALLIEATLGLAELQVTEVVRSCFEPSL
jgi:hypothetical protein